MGVIQILLISVSLAMDACAVAICQGLKMNKIDYKYAVTLALFFGIFQAIMPLSGWLLGIKFAKYIESIDHWIAFILLGAIGGKMICEAFESKKIDEFRYDYREMFALSIATSIDALAVGITFAMLNVNIVSSVVIIGVITFVLSFLGILIGNHYGIKYSKNAEIFGGIILICIGLKILLEDLGVLKSFI